MLHAVAVGSKKFQHRQTSRTRRGIHTSLQKVFTHTTSEVTVEKATTKGDIILVTGGNGFLGQHVVKQLQENAQHVREIRVLDLWPFTPKLGM